MHLPSFFANLHYVSPELARSLQPFTRRQWDALHRKHRFGSIVNLRGENGESGWYRDEVEACTAVGCMHFDIRLSSKRLPEREILFSVLDAFDSLPKPILIKCSGGADRTGIATVLYLLDKYGTAALPEAKRQLRPFPFLHFAKPYQRWIKEFAGFYEATSLGAPLRVWLAHIYSPEAFALYLTQKGKGDFWEKPGGNT